MKQILKVCGSLITTAALTVSVCAGDVVSGRGAVNSAAVKRKAAAVSAEGATQKTAARADEIAADKDDAAGSDAVRAGDGAQTVTVVFTVEKFVIGQGFFIAPEQVTVNAGASVADVFKQAMSEEGYTYSAVEDEEGFYLRGIDNADSGIADVPKSITGLASYLEDWEPNEDANLEEEDYTMFSGWMFSQNGHPLETYSSDVTVSEGDVIRTQFSLIWGSDIGLGDETWTGIKNPDLPDKEPLIKLAASIRETASGEGSLKMAYEAAIRVLENYDATADELAAVYTALEDAIHAAEDVTGQTAQQPTVAESETNKETETESSAENETGGETETESAAENETDKETVTEPAAGESGTDRETVRQSAALGDNVNKPGETEKSASRKTSKRAAAFRAKRAKISAVKVKIRKAKIKLAGVKHSSGYQVRYAASRKMRRAKTVSAKKNIFVIRHLRKGKVYFIKARAFAKIGKKKVYSRWSGIRRIKMKR